MWQRKNRTIKEEVTGKASDCLDPWFLRDNPHINGDDALRSFELTGTRPLYSFHEYRRKLFIDQSDLLKNGSLEILARLLDKDSKTIRRLCKLGKIRHSYPTKGGHWRVDYFKFTDADFVGVKEYLQKHGRPAVDDRGKIIDRLNRKARVTQSLLASIHPRSVKSKKTTPDSIRDLVATEPKKAQLVIIIKALHKQNRLYASAIAKEMGISRATLYRRFGQNLIRALIRKTIKPIDSELVVRSSDDIENSDLD